MFWLLTLNCVSAAYCAQLTNVSRNILLWTYSLISLGPGCAISAHRQQLKRRNDHFCIHRFVSHMPLSAANIYAVGKGRESVPVSRKTCSFLHLVVFVTNLTIILKPDVSHNYLQPQILFGYGISKMWHLWGLFLTTLCMRSWASTIALKTQYFSSVTSHSVTSHLFLDKWS